MGGIRPDIVTVIKRVTFCCNREIVFTLSLLIHPIYVFSFIFLPSCQLLIIPPNTHPPHQTLRGALTKTWQPQAFTRLIMCNILPEQWRWPSMAQSLLKKEHVFAVALTTSGKPSLKGPKSFVKGISKCIHFPAGLIHMKSKPCSTVAGVHFNRGWFKYFCLWENHEWSTYAVRKIPVF